jgi:hypothetical protein
MIYCAQDKINDRVNQRVMGQFHHFLNEAYLAMKSISGGNSS